MPCASCSFVCAPTALAAENLFLRKQLALYQERQVTPRRATNMTRFALVWLARWFDWRQALTIVKPDTLHPLAPRRVSPVLAMEVTLGPPPIPGELQTLIRQMAITIRHGARSALPTSCLLKLGLRVSPRTVRKYMPKRLDYGRGYRGRPNAGGRLSAIMPRRSSPVTSAWWSRRPFACSMCLSSWNTPRGVLSTSTSPHIPQQQWTMQQLREAIPADHGYRFLLHDRDSIFSQELDQTHPSSGAKSRENAATESASQRPV